jgi:CubicO group peptidase (beta-lactamase class C family)
LGVLYDGELFRHSVGLRDIESGLEADADTSYYLASCTKMITSAALAILVEDGKLSWKDTIQSHLPNFDPVEDPSIGAEATLIDACRHSTGLANPVAVMMGPDGTLSLRGEEHLDLVNNLPTSNHAGQRFGNYWAYSNATFGLMGLVIEALSHMKFADFIQKRILEPLQMNQTLVTKTQVQSNSNVAHPYVQMGNDTWRRIPNNMTSEDYTAVLACLGIRTSVNDMLAFLRAVMDRHDEELEQDSEPPVRTQHPQSPLRQVSSMWSNWWTRPVEDGFENDTRYLLGWYRTTIPSAALGLTSYNAHSYSAEDKPYIIGRNTPPHTVYGHNGIANGAVSTVYLIPESHSAVVVFSNAADAGDASEVVAKILLQALFDLKPHIDLIPYIRDARDRRLKAHEDMISDWRRGRDPDLYNAVPEELVGKYVGLGPSVINIVPSDSAAAKLAVFYGNNSEARCDLEPYNADALSFLPLKHDELLARSMIDWDFYKVGIFDFLRDSDNDVVALWWQWDENDSPGLWVKRQPGMSDDGMARVVERYGRFRKAAT